MPQKLSGFSLIEVVVSFAILASLGIALIQAQVNTNRMLYNLDRRDLVEQIIESQLQDIMIQTQLADITASDQKFPDDHPLFGATWSLTTSEDNFLELPVRRVSYSIRWEEDEVEREASGFLILELPTSLDQIIGG